MSPSDPSAVRVRPLDPADLPALAAINDDAHPAVPITSAAELGALADLASVALVAEDAVGIAGFVLALAPGRDYASENYVWFSERSDSFLYVDRIVLASRLRGRGVGRRLYDRVFEAARADGRGEVTCEVNVQPPNPESLAFHARLGFEEVGRQATKGGTVVVALLAAPIIPAEYPASGASA